MKISDLPIGVRNRDSECVKFQYLGSQFEVILTDVHDSGNSNRTLLFGNNSMYILAAETVSCEIVDPPFCEPLSVGSMIHFNNGADQFVVRTEYESDKPWVFVAPSDYVGDPLELSWSEVLEEVGAHKITLMSEGL